MKINIKKTKVMQFSKRPGEEFVVLLEATPTERKRYFTEFEWNLSLLFKEMSRKS